MAKTRTLHLFKAPHRGIATLARYQYYWPTPGMPHMHEHLQILLILSGKTDIIWEGCSFPLPLQADDICIVPPRLPHQVETRGQSKAVDLIDLHINLAHESELAQAWQNHATRQVTSGQAAIISQATTLLEQAVDLPSHARDHLLTACGWLVLGVATATPSTAAQQQVDRRLLAAEKFIVDHLKDPIGTPDIAHAAGLSVSQLNRLYRQHRQTTPANRVMEMRLTLAREMLPASPLALKQIARECGFICVNHFNRVFRQQVGMTPGQYRKQSQRMITTAAPKA